jgi:hypothetical protein
VIVAREKIALSDEAIETLFETEFSVGLTVDDLTFYSRGEMDRIREARRNWTDRGHTNDDTPDRLDLERVQATRGQRRQHLCAIAIEAYEAVYCG